MDSRVPANGRGLLASAGLRALFDSFPLPLALVAPEGGGRTVNVRFESMFGEGCLDVPELVAMVASPGEAPRRLTLPLRSGALLEAEAHALRAPDGIMLVIESSPGRSQDHELAQLRERIVELERLSATDRLTGAWNRAHLDRIVAPELARSHRTRQPVSLILVDIDHFKRVNDLYGHASGDVVLKEITQMLAASMRSADQLFRWGGEEFVVLAAATGYRAAAILAEKLRAAVEEHEFPSAGRLTVSAGVAEHLLRESPTAWFQRADAMLYAAKRSGRNRVSIDRRGNSDAWAAGGVTALRLAWTDEYECGEPSIDREHREIFDLANALIDAAAREGDGSQVRERLQTFAMHVEAHFRHEEEILARAAYPNLKAHEGAHASLRQRIADLQRAAEEDRVRFGDVVEFVASEVVARHLFTADFDYFPLFAGRAGRA